MLNRLADDVELKHRIGHLIVEIIDDHVAAGLLQRQNAVGKILGASVGGVEHQTRVWRDLMYGLHERAPFVVGTSAYDV